MDIDGIGLQNRPGDPPGSPFFAEDGDEIAAGTTIFALIGGAAAAVAAGPIVAGAAILGTLYAASCGIKWVLNR
jgi:hypothetical protein